MLALMDEEKRDLDGASSLSGDLAVEGVARVESELCGFLSELDSALRQAAREHQREVTRMTAEKKVQDCKCSIEFILFRAERILGEINS